DAVDEQSIEAGVTLSRWFGGEARRIYSRMGESDEDRERRQLVELIRCKGESVSVREWHRIRSHKSSRDAEAELEALVDARCGEWHIPAQTGRGRPTKRFVLVSDRIDADKNTAGGPESPIVSVSEVSEGPGNNSGDGADYGWCAEGEEPPPEVFEELAEAEGEVAAAGGWGEI
ncbi:unnamed protein product, partial [marine sediment metagenome]